MSSQAGSHAVRLRRRKAAQRRLVLRWTAVGVVSVAVVSALIGFVYAGSSDRIADGVSIAGVDLGGKTTDQALSLLQKRAAHFQHVPVVFVSGSHRWRITPMRLGVKVDWPAAVAAARHRGDGFGPIRGLKRLEVRVFGAHVAAPVQAWKAALNYQLSLFAKAIDRPHRDASLKLHGLRVAVVRGQDGHVLDRKAAAPLVVHALASFTRRPVQLPVRVDRETVTADDLQAAQKDAQTALSAPVRLTLGPTRWRIARWRIAPLLQLPASGSRDLSIGGRGADRFFARLSKTVGKPPRDATWRVTTKGIHVVASRDGIALQRVPTEKAALAALTSPTDRVAQVTVAHATPKRTTAQAEAMHITGLVGGYETEYGGDPNRIHNVQLVAHLIDGTLIAPGATFSFNQTTGDRNAAKGFLEAPVIINGELGTGLGGGVCQVSTTVFNAAFVAGLDITERTNHGLYISHYPLGRDATVDYPDIDLKFVNDSPRWLLLRTFVGPSSLIVNLYGTPLHRKVVSETAPLTVDGPVPVSRVDDPALLQGQTVVESSGSTPLRTSVRRKVYSPDGKLLHDDTWTSYYQGEKRVIKVGTKAPPPPKPTTTTPTTTTPTTTTPTTPTTTTPTTTQQKKPTPQPQP